MIPVDKELEWDPFVKKVMDKFDDLERKIELAVANTKYLVEQFDKIIKMDKECKKKVI